MSQLTDEQKYLLAHQYHNASNLNARIYLNEHFSTNQQSWQRWVFEQFHVSPGLHVLELGCGSVALWLQNRDRIPESWDITLSDFSQGMLREAQESLKEVEHSFTFQVVDIQAIPFEDESFDAVIANYVLHHVPDREKAFAEVRRVLKPGGRFYAASMGQKDKHQLDELVLRLKPDADIALPADTFFLENGSEELARSFSQVTLHRYHDELVVTEVAPLIAYVLSSHIIGPLLSEELLAQFRSDVEQEIATKGAFRITKDSGMFEAMKG
jgi:ubiquinone/menaquinone biosynthesis C-methylase UbiE